MRSSCHSDIWAMDAVKFLEQTTYQSTVCILGNRQGTFSGLICCGQIPLLPGRSTGGCAQRPQCLLGSLTKQADTTLPIHRCHLLKIVQSVSKLYYLEGERNCVSDALSRIRLQPKHSALNSCSFIYIILDE